MSVALFAGCAYETFHRIQHESAEFLTELTSVSCIDWTLCGSFCGKSNITVESGMRGAESMSIYRQLQQLQFAQRRFF